MTLPAWIAAALGRQFWILSYAMLVAGLCLPGDYHRLRPLVPVFLGGMLFCTCLRISLAEVRAALTPQVLGRSAVAVPLRLVVLPLVSWGIVRLVDPPWAEGVLLVAAAPAGMSSVAFADLYGGSRMFGLLQVLGTCLLCPVTVPLLLRSCGSGAVHDLSGQIGFLVALVGVPFVGAQVLRALAGGMVVGLHAWWSPLAVLLSCCLTFVAVASNRQAWQHWSSGALVEPLVLVCCISVVGFAAGQGSRLFLDRAQAIAFSCGELWVNNGLAIALASAYYAGQAHLILPAVLMQIPIIASIALYGWWTRREALAAVAPLPEREEEGPAGTDAAPAAAPGRSDPRS